MGQTDLQLGGGYRYQWECAMLLALNYFFDPVRYNLTLFDLINGFLGLVTEIHLEGEDRESGVDLEDVNLIGGDRRILIQVKTKQAEGKLWTPSDSLLCKALYKFYDSRFLTEQPDNTRFVFLTNRPFNPALVRVKSAIRDGTIDQCAEADQLCKRLDNYASREKGKSVDVDRFREMLARTALVEYLAVDEVKANVQAKLQAYGRRDWEQAHARLYEHFSRQSTLIGGGAVTRESVVELLGPLKAGPDAIPLPHNLPPRCLYVERDGYVDRVMEELSVAQETVWIVGICGPMGVGKTSLALEVAHRCLQQELFEGIVWMTAERDMLTTSGTVERKSVLTSLEGLYDEIAETLGCDEILKMGSAEDKRDAIGEILKKRRRLLVIDGIASLGGEETVRDLQDFVQPTKIIVTSRPQIEALDRVHRLEDMEQEPALELMRAECEAKEVKASDEELMTLYERTGGIPLAMVWCIGGMSKRPVSRVLKLMEKVEGELLQYCFAQSQEELSPEGKRVLRVLSLFVTSASHDALHAISGIEDEDDFWEAIDQSVDLSLARYEDGRYNLLPLTRTFVLSELEQHEPDEAIRLKRAYADYFLGYVEEHGSRSGDDLKAIEVEHKNVREAVDWCASQESEDVERTLPRFAAALHEFHWLRGYWNNLAKYNELAFEVSKAHKDWVRAGDHAYAVGFTRFQQGNLDQADRWGGEAVSAMTQAADEYHLARVKRLPAMVARERGDYQTSKRFLDEMLASAQKLLEAAESGEKVRRVKDSILVDALTSLANLERKKENYSEARRLYEESLATNRELGNIEKIGLNLNHLGRTDLAEYEQVKDFGQDDKATRYLALAEEHFTEGRKASEDAPRTDQILIGMWGQGRVAAERGEYAQALRLAQEALDRHGHSGAAEVAEVQDLLDRVECLVPPNTRSVD